MKNVIISFLILILIIILLSSFYSLFFCTGVGWVDSIIYWENGEIEPSEMPITIILIDKLECKLLSYVSLLTLDFPKGEMFEKINLENGN